MCTYEDKCVYKECVCTKEDVCAHIRCACVHMKKCVSECVYWKMCEDALEGTHICALEDVYGEKASL